MKKFFCFLIISLLSLTAFQAAHAGADLELLRKEFRNELLKPDINSQLVEHLINTINPDGTWPGINYKDVSRTGFEHGRHLNNLVVLSRAYKQPGSPFQRNAQLKKTIDLALNYWLANDFICENWWWNQIGTPSAMVSVLLIMDKDLSAEQVDKLLPIVGRANLSASGARPSGDRIKIAGILAEKLLFDRDSSDFAKVIKVIEGEIKFATGRGMQYDYSFHHRVDRVNNTLSYGTNYANVFAEWAANVAGTKYQFSEHAIHMLVDYYLDGICKMLVYGKYPDPGAQNRDITRPGDLDAFSPLTAERLLKATDYRKDELEKIVAVRKGEAVHHSSFSRFYWDSEHFTFQRNNFFTSVRMFSDRDYNMEYPYNGEGLMNHYRGDGTNYISRTGTEYDGLSPVYDWQKIPGTTIMQRKEMPPPEDLQRKGLTDFVGAVTDGKYGAVGFDFKSPLDPLKARKSWFFFDNKYVCLGAGITGDSDLQVVTTVNQCLLKSDVVVMAGNKRSVASKGEHNFNNIRWVLQDSIGYIFPVSGKVNLTNETQTGSWYKVNHQSDSPKDEISKGVFKLWIDHGDHPQNASYEYIVMPATTESQLEKAMKSGDVAILANTPQFQAVENNALHIAEAVFYVPGEIKTTSGITLSAKEPCIVMLKMAAGHITSLSVEDPTRKLAQIHLAIAAKINKQGSDFKASWDNNKKLSNIEVDLPQDVYAGKSVTIDL